MILDAIVANKRIEVAARKEALPLEVLAERLEGLPAPRDFRDALRREGISLIAEIKRQSPSKGPILPNMDVAHLATLYEQSGARAVSVLTDHKFFGGGMDDLVKAHTQTKLPCLRKEFIIDPYQIHEARAAGAAAVLLIVRILSDDELRSFHSLCRTLGISALVETHTEDEILRAVDCGAHIIGINNRDLDTLEIDLGTTLRLKKRVSGGHTLVSESGIHTRRDVQMLEDGGVDAILVGESILTSGNIRGKIQELLGHDQD
jgi:indole-3-glycerol phosphate synthase